MVEKFKDRKDAAKKLTHLLQKYKDKNPLILAIPRGGAEIGFELAQSLNAEFSLIITRKLPFPEYPESGFGAIAEDGSIFIFDKFCVVLDKSNIEAIINEQKQEINRRKLVLRKNKPLPEIRDRIVILTDDGIAMGSTMRAAIEMVKKKNPKKIIVAVPVASPRVAEEIKSLVDETVILTTPQDFHAVAEVYEDWYDVPDEKVLQIMDAISTTTNKK
jgi:predicted phosphoribosyltransferase